MPKRANPEEPFTAGTASGAPRSSLFRWLGRFAVRFRFLIVLVWLLVTVVATLTLPSLLGVTDSNNLSFLPANSPSISAAQLASSFQQGNLPTAVIVASRSGGRLSAADQAAITRVEAAAGKVDGVLRVVDQGVSDDGQARKVLLILRGDALGGGPAPKPYVQNIRATFEQVNAPAGLQLTLTGEVATLYDQSQSNQSTFNLTELLSVLFIIVLLLVIYRSLLAPFLTLLPAGLVLTLSQPVIAELHSLVGLQISPITAILLTVLLLGAGTDYGLFLVFRVREEMRGGLSSHDAIVESVARVGETITFSAGTVIAALLCLLFATFGFYQGLGPALAIGIGLMLVAGVTLLPALLAIFGSAAFWPSNVRPGEPRIGLWGRLAGRIVQQPVPVLAVGLLLFGGLAIGVLSYSPTGFAGGGSASTSSQSSQGDAALSAHFPVAQSNPTDLIFRYPTSVWESPSVLRAAGDSLGKSPVFASVDGPLDPNGTQLTEAQLSELHAALGPPQALPNTPPPTSPVSPSLFNAYRSTAQFISPDGHTVLFYATLKAGNPTSTAAMRAMPTARSAVNAAASASGATASGVAGEAAFDYDIATASDSDLVHIVPIVLLVIGALLAIVLRSLVAPWYLLASVGVSYLASLGLAVFVFVRIGGQPGLNFLLPFLMFVFLLALGEDYNILVMTRIREEAHSSALGPAVERAVNATGTTVTSAGMVLAGTFLVLTVAGGSQVQQIGFGIAAGILMDTFLVRTLLIPSTAVLLGRWNWWPSRLQPTELKSQSGENGRRSPYKMGELK
jgi:RND superfamily putative drug exporter